jgi:AraC-like DNA-binding protein
MPLSPIGGLVNSYVDALRSELTTDRDFKRLINNFTGLIAVGLGSGERLISAPPLLDAYYEQALDIIGNGFRDQRLQSAYVAERLGISERTLFKAFEQRERSFHSELTMRRIGAASLRLRRAADSASILDILFDSGFESVSTFSRSFKAVHGMTASEYRNRARRLASS